MCVCVRTGARRAAVDPSPTPGVQLEPAWTRSRSVTLLAATQERCLPLLQMSCSIILTTERKIYDMIPSSLSLMVGAFVQHAGVAVVSNTSTGPPPMEKECEAVNSMRGILVRIISCGCG